MIAVVGKVCSGKTTFLKKLEQEGKKVFIADEFVKSLYENKDFCQKIQKLINFDLLTENKLDKFKIKKLFSENKDLFEEFEKQVHLEVFKYLSENKFDFAEIPALNSKHANFCSLISKIYVHKVDENTRIKFCKKRNVDSESLKILDALNSYNWTDLKNYNGILVVDKL
ncbi:dephospho-CoA kinase [Mycoplasmopsis synoviae]|uniref:dephospho-CoA kinase n=1 Tax=Mycoplasmopsis synoviae TaxID=2109 RepID=UPI001CE11D95|nr:dephospho-CoA kinase [Mycoplasmopsis synoviae]UBX97480.1 dephospho-CoA kinase [Mycoplasmopsis synoviae]